MLRTVLVANRGEIACRIIQTAKRVGLRTVAVYSEADIRARHVEMADEAVNIGPAPVAESYLNPNRILDAARSSTSISMSPPGSKLASFVFVANSLFFSPWKQAKLPPSGNWIFKSPAYAWLMKDVSLVQSEKESVSLECTSAMYIAMYGQTVTSFGKTVHL